MDGALVSAIGDHYEIAFTDIKLDGADSGNYELATTEFTTQGGDFSIIRAKISLTTSYYTLLKVFDGSTAIKGDYLTGTSSAITSLWASKSHRLTRATTIRAPSSPSTASSAR